MPHDKNGNLLTVGDQVLLRCKITQVSEGETQCNVTAEAAERPEGEGYIPTIAGNSRFYDKASAYEVFSGKPSEKAEVDIKSASLMEAAPDLLEIVEFLGRWIDEDSDGKFYFSAAAGEVLDAEVKGETTLGEMVKLALEKAKGNY